MLWIGPSYLQDGVNWQLQLIYEWNLPICFPFQEEPIAAIEWNQKNRPQGPILIRYDHTTFSL